MDMNGPPVSCPVDHPRWGWAESCLDKSVEHVGSNGRWIDRYDATPPSPGLERQACGTMKETPCDFAVTGGYDRTDDGRRAACRELQTELPRGQCVSRGWELDLVIGDCQRDDAIAAPIRR